MQGEIPDCRRPRNRNVNRPRPTADSTPADSRLRIGSAGYVDREEARIYFGEENVALRMILRAVSEGFAIRSMICIPAARPRSAAGWLTV